MIDVYTLDSGRYRCEASNGWRRVETVATLTVSFSEYRLLFSSVSALVATMWVERIFSRGGKSGFFQEVAKRIFQGVQRWCNFIYFISLTRN